MDTLLELAARCEQATGPDAFLDLDIHRMIGDDPQAGLGEALDYTLSLDDAMTLVPERCRWTLKAEFSEGVDTPLEYWSDCSPGYGKQRELGYGKTPALALCAAALRARAANPRRKEG